ncbi:MAG TPA: hypothetical protein PLT66_05185, partial [Bacillota bacterium]|nr:hypothetical protein [Bacillota bacterium]
FLLFSTIMFLVMFVWTKMPVLMIVYIMVSVIYFWYFSHYTKIEYEYVISSATFRMESILAQRKRSVLFETPIKDIEKLVPYAGNKSTYEASDIEKKIFCASSINSPDLYICVYRDESGKKTAALFDATNKALSIFKFYNSSATVIKQVRY